MPNLIQKALLRIPQKLRITLLYIFALIFIGFIYELASGIEGFFSDLVFYRILLPIAFFLIGIFISLLPTALIGVVLEFLIGVERANKFIGPLFALSFIALLIYNFGSIVEVLSTPISYEINILYWDEIKNLASFFADGIMLLTFLFYGIFVFGLGSLFVAYCWILIITLPLNAVNEKSLDRITEILFSIPSIILFMASGPVILYFFFSG